MPIMLAPRFSPGSRTRPMPYVAAEDRLMESLPQHEFAGTERFSVLRRLGEGGMGIVFEAIDRERDLVVALKTIRDFDPSALYWFKKEFRVLENVVHPNLVRLWELFSDGDRWFFTMELVHGTNFFDYVRPADWSFDGGIIRPMVETLSLGASPPPTEGEADPSTLADTGTLHGGPGVPGTSTEREVFEATEPMDGPAQAALPPVETTPAALDVERLRSAMRQLAGAISTLHSLGKLHRDLKPSNVMVERGGRVVVLDFGVAAELRGLDDPDSTENHVVGTIGYMSPEQATGGVLTPASDWYSVGVMLYAALTGRLPYLGTGLDLLTRKIREDPPPPAQLMGGLPEDLCELCMEMLRRSPEERPLGDEILRRLGSDGPISATGAESLLDRPFLGRGPHLAALAGSLEVARRGRAVVAFVQGRSGVGKSALVQHFFGGLRPNEVVVLEGRCFEQESVAYKALDALVDALSRFLRRLSRLEVEALMPRDIATLARVFPVLRRIEAVAGAPHRSAEPPDPQELRRRAFAALRELMGRISDRRPLILHIDDLQWGDLDSADLLADLLRPPDAPALLLLCCFRSEYASSSPCLLRLRAGDDGAQGPERFEVEVEALTADEARDLARMLLARAGHVTDELIDLIARESGGSPYFVYELTHYLTAGGKLSGSLAGAGTFSLDEVLWRRVRELPAGPRRLLEAISVAGQPVRQTSACRVAGLGTDGFAALSFLRANNLVRGRGPGALDVVEAYHDRIRETVERRLTPAEREAWHLKLALELEETGEADPETLSVHFAAGGRAGSAAGYVIRAAADAVAALAFDRATTLYRRALDLTPADDPGAPALRVCLAEALANAGRGSEAGEMFLIAAAEAGPESVHDLQARAAYQFLISGRIDEGLAAFDEVLTRVGLKRPETPKRALLQLIKERVFLTARGLGYRPRKAEQIPPANLTRVDIARAVAVGISVVDVIQGSYFQTRSLRLALDAGEPTRIALSLGWEGVHSACLGRSARRRTARLIALSEQVARVSGQPHALGMATLSAGAALYMAGRFGDAIVQLDAAASIFRENCTGVVWELDTTQIFGLWSRIYRGEIAELTRRFQSLDQEARDRGDRYMESTLGTYPGAIARLAADDPGEARQMAEEAIARWSQHGFHVQHLTHYYGHTYINLYEGQGAAAWERSERTWPAIRASLLPRIQHVAVDVLQIRGRSAVAAALDAKDPRPLLRQAARFARGLDRQRMAWGQVAARLIRAGAASIRGDSPRAAKHLTDAIGRADAEQIELFAAAARRRLGVLLGGDEGRDLVARADAWMAAQSIRNPERMAACLVPGFPGS
jgi:serine/threonine protein kinase/tetratricopeptide (TPR) repeat protein